MIRVTNREISRYLGYRGIEPDPQIQKIIDEVTAELQTVVRPKCLHRMEPFYAEGDDLLHLGPITVQSHDLGKTLRGCTHVVLIGATLGAAPDQLIRRYEATDMMRASVAQAVSAAMIESFLDQEQAKLDTTYESLDLFLRPRYSPGYGDLSLSIQSEMLAVLQMPKHLGVTLTDGLLMVPSKSITAIIGLSPVPFSHHADSCALCGKENCVYRKM